MATQVTPTGIQNNSSPIENITLATDGGVDIDAGHLVVAHGDDVTVNSPLQVNSTLNATGNVTLNGTLEVTGSTDFAGFVNADRLFVDNTSNPTAPVASFSAGGTLIGTLASSGLFIGGSGLQGGANIELNSSGSAEFAGGITLGDDGVYPFTNLQKGYVSLYPAADNTFAFSVSRNGFANSDKTVSILGNGSATFARSITSGPSAVIDGRQRYLSIGADNIGVGGQSIYSQAYYTTDNRIIYSIRTDGSAEFASGGITLNSNGSIFANGNVIVDKPANNQAFIARLQGVDKAWINSNGSAEFAGSVSIGGKDAAHTIDEYEEGTWVPTLHRQQEDNGWTTTPGANNRGLYTRVGNLVTVTMQLQQTFSGGNGFYYVGGLPFSVTNQLPYHGTATLMKEYGYQKELFCLNGHFTSSNYFIQPLDHTNATPANLGSGTEYFASWTYTIPN